MSALPKDSKFLRHLVEFEAHHRVTVALVVAALAFGIVSRWLKLEVSLIVAWDVFALCSLVLAWAGIFFTDAKTRVEEARLQDSSRTVIGGCLVTAAIAGLFGAAWLLRTAKNAAGNEAIYHATLAVLTVVVSWLLVHTVMSLHYAHLFYQGVGRSHPKSPGCGLNFPNAPQPDFLDFAYFSFVIGMTCQTADVEITSRHVRRTALLHGLLAFAFNAVIVALSLNLASSLL